MWRRVNVGHGLATALFVELRDISAGIRRLPLKAPCAARAVTRAVIGEQGLITEAGYQEQAKSYEDMANAAGVAIKADELAAQGAYGGAAIAGVAAVASLFTGGAVGGGGGGVNSIARRVRLPTRAQSFRSHFTAVRITKSGCGTPYLSE
jgi:hypothetical protein